MAIQQVHTYCAMCISRCGVLATVEDGLLKKVNADPDHPNGCICVKGTAAPEIVYSPDRLAFPMKRTPPRRGRRRPTTPERTAAALLRLSRHPLLPNRRR